MDGARLDEDERANWRLILTPAGIPWSGRARYAAAMFFHQRGQMSDEVLEIYRICSRLDGEDAVDALRAYHMGEAWADRVARMRALVDAAAADAPRQSE